MSGPVQFSTSGLATIPGGDDRVIVSPGVALNGSSKVLATLMGNPGGTVALRRVAVQDAADTFTIFLSGAAANSVKVAWFVMR